MDDRRPVLTLANVLKAVRDPLMMASRLRRRFAPPPGSPNASHPREPVNVSADELFQFIIREHQNTICFDDLFRQHPKLTLAYEDMVDHAEEVFGQAQTFLGLEQRPLNVTMRRQNPEPLGELIENYHELFEAYKGSPHAWMFE